MRIRLMRMMEAMWEVIKQKQEDLESGRRIKIKHQTIGVLNLNIFKFHHILFHNHIHMVTNHRLQLQLHQTRTPLHHHLILHDLHFYEHPHITIINTTTIIITHLKPNNPTHHSQHFNQQH